MEEMGNSEEGVRSTVFQWGRNWTDMNCAKKF